MYAFCMGDDSAVVCMANIGPRGIARRMRVGVVGMTLSVVLGVALVMTGAPMASLVGVFLAALVGGFGVFQARERT